jgi:hypothetical protein
MKLFAKNDGRDDGNHTVRPSGAVYVKATGLKGVPQAMSRGKQRNVPPSITVRNAIELLKRQIDRSDELRKLFYNDPRIEAWLNIAEAILTSAFGLPNGELHRNTHEFQIRHIADDST